MRIAKSSSSSSSAAAAAAAAMTLWSIVFLAALVVTTVAFQPSSLLVVYNPRSSIVRIRSRSDDGVLSPHSNPAHNILLLHAVTAIKDDVITNDDDDVATIQILMSDTGGGHRASANALRDAFTTLHETYPNQYPNRIVCDIVDIYTDYGPFPYNQFVPAYKIMAEYTFLWKWAYETGGTPFGLWFYDIMCELLCFNPFMECMMRNSLSQVEVGGGKGIVDNNNNSKRRADMVISVHPLCQSIPLKVLTHLDTAGASRTIGRTTPFVTVVTDLGGAHPSWFNPAVDKCYVPSNVLYNCALQRNVQANQIVQYGLPIRRGFWGSSTSGSTGEMSKTTPPHGIVDNTNKQTIRQSLELQDIPTVLIVGGGDGMGGIVKQAVAVGERLQKLAASSSTVSLSNDELVYQMVVVCGNNKVAQTTLSPSSMDWGNNINVCVHGFVNNMDEFMRASDILVTKAGPGTIAEASICGLPCILSSFLPGQEEGNVDYVVEAGFGCYQGNPDGIANTVEEWLGKSEMLEQMKCNALLASRPDATMDIARDLANMLYKRREELKNNNGKTSSSSQVTTATMMAK
jgi:1,2-diacylglycerol 3-beta-galactosyltransferase